MSDKKARELGLKPMARFVSFAVGGVPPEIMGIGPVVAIPKALRMAGSEARRHRRDRAERSVRRAGACGRSRQAGLNMDKLNVNGGAVALGHPLGCTGAKLTATISARNAAPGRALRHGDDVRRRRPGRGRNFRAAIDGTEHGSHNYRDSENQRRRVPNRRRAQPESIFTPEDLTEEHRAIARPPSEFFNERSRAASRSDSASAITTVAVRHPARNRPSWA